MFSGDEEEGDGEEPETDEPEEPSHAFGLLDETLDDDLQVLREIDLSGTGTFAE